MAESFARLFFRNAINEGLPVIECPEAISHINHGDVIKIDFEAGKLYAAEKTFEFKALPEAVLGILKDGGLIPHVKKELGIKD